MSLVVRRTRFGEHANNDAEESAEFRHRFSLRRAVSIAGERAGYVNSLGRSVCDLRSAGHHRGYVYDLDRRSGAAEQVDRHKQVATLRCYALLTVVESNLGVRTEFAVSGEVAGLEHPLRAELVTGDGEELDVLW